MERLPAPNEFFRMRRLREGMRRYGLESVRQRAWRGLDARTCGPVPGCAPKNGRDAALDLPRPRSYVLALLRASLP
jgi:hypothetical protein